ncbi:MAG: hypothetical protein Devi2KO_33490 [Devosia indica]
MTDTKYPATVYARFIHDTVDNVVRPAADMKDSKDHLEAYSGFAFKTYEEAVLPVVRNIALAWAKAANGKGYGLPSPSKITIVKCKVQEDGFIESGWIEQTMWADKTSFDGLGGEDQMFHLDLTRADVEHLCQHVEVSHGMDGAGAGDGIIDSYLERGDGYREDMGFVEDEEDSPRPSA